MAGVGGRAAAHLSRHLTRLRLLQGNRLTQGHAAAFLHTTPALDAGIYGWDEDDETGSFMEGLFEGLTEMTAHYSPSVKESTLHPVPTQHKETVLGKEKEARRDKRDSSFPGVSVTPLVNSLPVTHSVKRNDVGQASGVSEKGEPETVQYSHEFLHKDTKPIVLASALDQHPTQTSTTSHKEEMVQLQEDQLKGISEKFPSPENLPAAPEQMHAMDKNHFAGVPAHVMPVEATSQIELHLSDLTSVPLQMQKDRNGANGVDFVDKSLDTDTSPGVMAEEELHTHALDSTKGGDDSPDTTDISSVPQVPNDSKDVQVGTLIALMVAEGEDWKTVEMPSSEEGAASPPPTGTVAPGVATKEPAGGDGGHGNFGPSVRLLLEQYGLQADDVPHGGPHGILVKGDVLRFVKERSLQPKAPESVPPPEAPKPAAAAAPSKPSPPPVPTPGVGGQSGYIDIEVTSMRRTIAKRLTQSKTTIAHSYASMECRMDSLLELRKQFKEEGVNVSVNDLIIKSVAVALSRCPDMNCVWQGDQLKVGGPVDISVAVATPAGLITPIVRGADTRGLEDIAATVRDLATRAKENKLKLDEFQGGTFTISNLGMFGIKEFSAIINPPQCGILAVGGSRLVPDESGMPVPLMISQLSFDRNAVDDFQAAEFLDTLKTLMENPKTIILGSYASQPHPLAALL